MPEAAFRVPKFHIEHIRAQQHGGGEDLDNLALACDRCNAFKGPNLSAVDPLTQAIVPLFHPRQHQWKEHFRVVGSEIVGLTPTGRATAALLNMNARGRLELRKRLGAWMDSE